MKTTILKGITIGNNVIIGANSLVCKDIPDNVVVAGNPAHVILGIDEYYKKRKAKQKDEATECAIKYYNTYKKWPDKKYMHEFLWLFEERNEKIYDNKIFKEVGQLVGNYDYTLERFLTSEGEFDNYNSFIEYCKEVIKDGGIKNDT